MIYRVAKSVVDWEWDCGSGTVGVGPNGLGIQMV